MFGEHYAEYRTDDNEGWWDALTQLCDWLEADEPFCHIRFADGEFHAITGTAEPTATNSDGHQFFPAMGVKLAQVLDEIAAEPDHGRLLVGGDWSTEPEHRQYLADHDLFRRVPWVPSQVFVTGVEDLSALRFLRALIARRGQIVMVGNMRIAQASVSLGARFVEVPAQDAWLDSLRIEDEVLDAIDTAPSSRYGEDSNVIVIYCAGMPSKAWAWRLWNETNRTTTHIDMGHFFDLAYGIHSRVWHTEVTEVHSRRARAYMQHFAPLIRGEA